MILGTYLCYSTKMYGACDKCQCQENPDIFEYAKLGSILNDADPHGPNLLEFGP